MTVKKHIPNFITSMNLLCGVLGVIAAFSGRLDHAFILMLAAAVFDFLDGFAARLLGAYSDMGKELDSLCDVVSFGVLPAVMLLNLKMTVDYGLSFWDYVPVPIAVFSALRLAKFNVDPRQAHGFIGLPTPACAMICGSLCYFVSYEPSSFLSMWVLGDVFIPVLTVALCYLLVSEIPMFSLKFSKDDTALLKRKRLFLLINQLVIAAIVAIVGYNWSMVILLGMTVYVLMNIVFSIVKL